MMSWLIAILFSIVLTSTTRNSWELHNDRYNVDGSYGLMDAILRSLEPHVIKDITTARPLQDMGLKKAMKNPPGQTTKGNDDTFTLNISNLPPYLTEVSERKTCNKTAYRKF